MKQVVIISGAASGLGLSLTKKFLEQSDKVYGITKTKKNWNQLKKEIPNLENLQLFQADISKENAVKKFISNVKKRSGRIDILINNAGYANRPTRTEKESLAEFQKNISSNLLSVFLMCKYSLPIFQRQKNGTIINISSMAGKRAVPLLSAYSASKSGVVALSQSIAKENSDNAFKCITVCPGGINTKMRAKLFGKEDAERQQSTDFVAEKIMEIVNGRISVESGGDIVIRHGKITAVNPPPEP